MQAGWKFIASLSFVTVCFAAAPLTPVVVDAAHAGNLSSVRKLIKEKADVNAISNDGSTALLWAAYHGDADMAKALLAAGASVDVPNRYGVTPLQIGRAHV